MIMIQPVLFAILMTLGIVIILTLTPILFPELIHDNVKKHIDLLSSRTDDHPTKE